MLWLSRMLFLALFFALPITLAMQVGPIRVYTLDVVLAPLLAVLLLTKLLHPGRLRFRALPTDFVVVCIFLAVLLSFGFSGQRSLSMPNLADWARYVLIYFAARLLFESAIVEARQFENVLVAVGLLLTAVGLAQLLTGSHIGVAANYFGSGDTEGSKAAIQGMGVVNRISGTTPNANVYVTWLNLFLAFALTRWWFQRRYLHFFLTAAIGGLVVVSTLARGGTFAFLLFLLLLVFWGRQRLLDSKFVVLSMVVMVGLLGVVASGFLPDSLQPARLLEALSGRLEQGDQGGVAVGGGRLMQIRMGLDALSHLKILLLGTGSAYFYHGTIIIHNMWMQILVEQGLAVFLTVVALFVAFLLNTRRFRRSGTTEAEMWSMYIWSTMPPFLLVSSQVYHTTGDYEIMIPVLALMAFVASRVAVPARRPESQPSRSQGSAKAAERLLRPAVPLSVLGKGTGRGVSSSVIAALPRSRQ